MPAHSTPRVVTQLLRSTITVKELIDALQEFEPNAKVLLSADYGDHCHTRQALAVANVEHLEVSGYTLAESGYSNSGVEVAETDDDTPVLGCEVVILS